MKVFSKELWALTTSKENLEQALDGGEEHWSIKCDCLTERQMNVRGYASDSSWQVEDYVSVTLNAKSYRALLTLLVIATKEAI